MSNSNKNYQPFLNSLDKLGFCTFRVFEEDTILQLRKLYSEHFEHQPITGLYASHNANVAEKGLAISKSIQAIVQEHLQQVFPEYDYFLGHFMVKGAHVNKEFALHQDWNIVDEAKYKSYQVWIPLQLTSPENGGIFVVPGSHKFFNNYRSGSYGIPVVPDQEEIKHIATDLIIPPSNILIYHNGLFHASHPNHTNQIRIAVIVNYVERTAPTYFFQKNSNTAKTELYPITGNSLVAHLPEFEKGIINPAFSMEQEVDICATENNKITYWDLVTNFRKMFPETQAAQVKQLHVTNDYQLEQQMNEDGFAVLDLLNNEEVTVFKDKYLSLFGDIDREPGRFTTLQDTNQSTKVAIHEFIQKHIQKPLERYFNNFAIPVSQYYTKKANTSGDIDLHADSTLLLNHQLEPHYAIWIPLVDVDENNGCLTVVPRSHKNPLTMYGGSFPGRQNEHREWLRQFEIPIRLKAGQALVFDNNLLHNSTANITNGDRICFTFRMIHSSSDLYSFIAKTKTAKDLDIYLETPNYYMADNWDGEGRCITGQFSGILFNGVRDFKKEELINNSR